MTYLISTLIFAVVGTAQLNIFEIEGIFQRKIELFSIFLQLPLNAHNMRFCQQVNLAAD